MNEETATKKKTLRPGCELCVTNITQQMKYLCTFEFVVAVVFVFVHVFLSFSFALIDDDYFEARLPCTMHHAHVLSAYVSANARARLYIEILQRLYLVVGFCFAFGQCVPGAASSLHSKKTSEQI